MSELRRRIRGSADVFREQFEAAEAGHPRLNAALQVAVFVVIAGLASVLATRQFSAPDPVPASAPPIEFSAERAMPHVEAISESPRPQGSLAARQAREYIVDQGTNLEFGARPLRRALERLIEDPLSEEILRGAFAEKPHVKVKVKDGHLFFEACAKPPKAKKKDGDDAEGEPESAEPKAAPSSSPSAES